jgi:hypothetical protein
MLVAVVVDLIFLEQRQF